MALDVQVTWKLRSSKTSYTLWLSTRSVTTFGFTVEWTIYASLLAKFSALIKLKGVIMITINNIFSMRRITDLSCLGVRTYEDYITTTEMLFPQQKRAHRSRFIYISIMYMAAIYLRQTQCGELMYYTIILKIFQQSRITPFQTCA